MTRSLSRSYGIAILLFVVLAQPIQAQNIGQRFLRRIGLGTPGKNEKLHDDVLKAFRGVVAKPSKSTVRILAEGKRVAYGAVIDKEGHVLTKASEVMTQKKLDIRLSNGKRYGATLVGIHRPTDVGLLKVTLLEKAKLTPIAWAKDDAEVGSWLVTTGVGANPVCIGVASVKPRKIPPRRGLLGVGLREPEDGEDGPAITEILPNSAAAKAKLRRDDVVTHVNGKAVKQLKELQQAIQGYRPGHRVRLKIVRDGAGMEKSVTLGDFDQIASPNHFQNGLGGPRSKRRGGFETALQHDSFLRPADCGGPIVNLDGKAVGINIARSSRISSFAIPVSALKSLIPKLKAGRYPVKATDEEKLSKLANSLQKLESKQRRAKAKFAAQQSFVKKFESELKKAEKSKDKGKVAAAKKKLAAAKKDLSKIKKDVDRLAKQIVDIKDKL